MAYPQMFRVRQHFARPQITDIPAAVRDALADLGGEQRRIVIGELHHENLPEYIANYRKLVERCREVESE